jgi:hypothetical protein
MERTEARILDTNNILIAPSTLAGECSIENFCGTTIAIDEISASLPSFSQKTVYLCGDLSQIDCHNLNAAERIFAIKDLWHGYNPRR